MKLDWVHGQAVPAKFQPVLAAAAPGYEAESGALSDPKLGLQRYSSSEKKFLKSRTDNLLELPLQLPLWEVPVFACHNIKVQATLFPPRLYADCTRQLPPLCPIMYSMMPYNRWFWPAEVKRPKATRVRWTLVQPPPRFLITQGWIFSDHGEPYGVAGKRPRARDADCTAEAIICSGQ